jgi:hypothetical protein
MWYLYWPEDLNFMYTMILDNVVAGCSMVLGSQPVQRFASLQTITNLLAYIHEKPIIKLVKTWQIMKPRNGKALYLTKAIRSYIPVSGPPPNLEGRAVG